MDLGVRVMDLLMVCVVGGFGVGVGKVLLSRNFGMGFGLDCRWCF